MAPQATPPTDPLTALHSLSQLFDPHLKTLVLVALLAGPLGISQGIKGLSLSLPTSPGLLGVVLLLGAFTRPGGGPALVGYNGEPRAAGADSLGPYLKICLVGYLFSQISLPSSYTYSLPPTVPEWVIWTLPAAVVTLGFVLPTTRLHGPIRFASLECSRTVFPTFAASDWWLYPVFTVGFGPPLVLGAVNKVGSTGCLGIALAALAWTYHNYDAQLRAVTKDVGHHAAVATAALSSAREYSAATARYEEHLLGKGIVREGILTTASVLQKPPRDEKADSSGASASQHDAIFQIALAAESTARLVENAVGMAKKGDMAGARQQVTAAETAASHTLAIMETIRQDMLQAKGQVRTSKRT